MVAKKILVPYNFTPYEEKTLDLVIDTYSGREDVKISIFNAYTPVPELDSDASPELAKMRDGLFYLTAELHAKEEGLRSARLHLLDNGFSEEQVDYVFKKRDKSVADEIIDAVMKGHYRILVLSKMRGGGSRLFTRSTHSRVLAVLRDVTVCIAT